MVGKEAEVGWRVFNPHGLAGAQPTAINAASEMQMIVFLRSYEFTVYLPELQNEPSHEDCPIPAHYHPRREKLAKICLARRH